MRRARPQVRHCDEPGVALALDDDAALASCGGSVVMTCGIGRAALGERRLAVEERARVDVEVAGQDRLAVVGWKNAL
jgi:hypothetical protein